MLEKKSKSQKHIVQILTHNYFKKYPMDKKLPEHKQDEGRNYVMD